MKLPTMLLVLLVLAGCKQAATVVPSKAPTAADMAVSLKPVADRLPGVMKKLLADDDATSTLSRDLKYDRMISLVRTDVVKTDSELNPLAGLVVLSEHEWVDGGPNYKSNREIEYTLRIVEDGDHWKLIKANLRTLSDASSAPSFKSNAGKEQDVSASAFLNEAVKIASSSK